MYNNVRGGLIIISSSVPCKLASILLNECLNTVSLELKYISFVNFARHCMSASVLYAGAKPVHAHFSFPGAPIDELGLEQVLLLGAIVAAAAAMNCWRILLPKSSKSAVWAFFFSPQHPYPCCYW